MKRPQKVGATSAKRDVNVIFNRRAALLSIGGVGVMGAIAARMAYLQTLDPTDYRSAADENRFDTRIIAPPRGVIYDRFGVQLAITSKNYQVSVVQADVEDLETVVAKVGDILGRDSEWVRRAVISARGQSRFEPARLAQDLTWEEFNAINVRLPELPGVRADASDVRSYPFDIVFAHPIGYVQKPTARDVEQAGAVENGAEGQRRAVYLRHPDVRVGKAGLEASLETTLHGSPGWRKVVVNARGREMGEDPNERRDATQGSGVVLTIDSDLQRIAMQSFGQEAGSCVVMDIYTGDLLVLASAPGFDPNLFVNGIGQADFDGYNLDEKKPLFHKCVTGVYPPGSTFKMIVGIAAKQAGIADDWAVGCSGYFPYGGRVFHCWRPGGHGRMNLHNAIKNSCDVYFYQAALQAGPERIAAVARQFGLGEHFDINVPNIRDGLIPDPIWWRENRNEGWTGGLTVNYGIGQGAMGVTPLQLAVMAARLGNNGLAVRPRLVRDAPGLAEPPQPARMAGIEAEYLARVRDGMFGVCNEPGGTAMRAGALELVRNPETGEAAALTPENRHWPAVQIAGKTGTAQVRALGGNRGRHYSTIEWKYRDHGLFACFGPWHEPRYACGIVIEHGGSGSGVAGPIAREVMRATLLSDPLRRAPARLAALEGAPRGQQA